VDKSSQVDQLSDCSQECGPLIPAANGFFGQEQKRRPEHLALHLEQVGVHLSNKAEIGLHNAPELLLDLIEARA
jgi:hypothetical protein